MRCRRRAAPLPRTIIGLLIAGLLASSAALAAGSESASLAKCGAVLRHEMIRWLEAEKSGATAPPPPSAFLPTITGSDGETRIPCWIRLSAGTLPPAWLTGTHRAPDLVSARITREEISRLIEEPAVVSVRAATKVRSWLDISGPEINAQFVHAGSGTPPSYSGFTGAGVIVGIVDSGIDIEHEDFLTAAGTRLISIWDQGAGIGAHPAGFNYGREWTTQQIDAGLCTETDDEGHGSHVMGIAAGNGAATGNDLPGWTYVGIAPEASLVVVKFDFMSGSTADIADGVDYIFRKADALGMPAVVNLSLGHQRGPHDGTEELEQAVSDLAGPNHIVVASAGNEQADSIHAEATLAVGESATITLKIPDGYQVVPNTGDPEVLIEGYYPRESAISMTVLTPQGEQVGPAAAGQHFSPGTIDGGVDLVNEIPAGQDGTLSLDLYESKLTIPPRSPGPGTWTITLENTGKTGAEDPATVDFWLYYTNIEGSTEPYLLPVFVQGQTARKQVGSPANGDSVIAVGAYVTRRQWTSLDGNNYQYQVEATVGDLAFFSNHGPRRDGVLKPEVAAPGMGIGSSLSRDASFEEPWKLPDGQHVIAQGTSMSAPHVAGLVALMLQAYQPTPQAPAMSVRDVRSILESTARGDAFATDLPNESWGAGKIDALGATEQETPILLSSVSAVLRDDVVLLEWSVPLDLASAWFDVIRQADGASEEVRGSVGPGPEYSFSDTLSPGVEDPLYWLAPTDSRVGVDRMGPYRPVGGASVRPALALSPPIPNPSSGTVRFTLTVPGRGEVSCAIFDPAGRLVWDLAPVSAGPGPVEFLWDGADRHGLRLPAGLYWIRTAWNGQTRTGKVLRIPERVR